MHIVVPIEIKNREFESKTWLGGLLASNGHTVTLGQSKIIRQNINKIKPDIYFEGSAVDRLSRRNRVKKLNKIGSKIVVLDTEGGAWRPENGSFTDRVDPNILEHVEKYFAWGESSANIAKNMIEKHDLETDVVQSGNPRFDLLQPDMRSLYSNEINRIRKKHREFILINTNFTVNHANIEKNKQSALQSKQEMYKIQSRLLSEFISLVYEIDQKFSQYDIVLRPHPNECSDTYRTLLHPYKQVEITKSGEARPWILASEVMIHNSCTTGIEAGLMQQPVVSYMTDIYHNHPSNNIGYTANDSKEVFNYIQQVSEQNTIEVDIDYINQFIENTEQKAAEIICKAIGDNKINGNISFPSLFNSKSMTDLAGKLLYKINSKAYRKVRNSDHTPDLWTYFSYKFNLIKLEEVQHLINKFSRWYNQPILVEEYKYNDNLFRLQGQNRCSVE